VERTPSVEFWGWAVLIKRGAFVDERPGDIVQPLRAEYREVHQRTLQDGTDAGLLVLRGQLAEAMSCQPQSDLEQVAEALDIPGHHQVHVPAIRRLQPVACLSGADRGAGAAGCEPADVREGRQHAGHAV